MITNTTTFRPIRQTSWKRVIKEPSIDSDVETGVLVQSSGSALSLSVDGPSSVVPIIKNYPIR